jgi:hypothetical protein
MPNPDNKYALTGWTSNIFNDLECPSGQVCQVRRPGVEGLVRHGLLDKVDSITSMINQKHIKRVKGEKVIDEKSLMSDPQALMKAMTTIDKVICFVVAQPHIELPIKVVDGVEQELPENEYVDGVVYTSMVGIEDKMFIFNYSVGGSKDLEKFRLRSGESVPGMDDV